MAKAAWNRRSAEADGKPGGSTNFSDALPPSENGENYAERGIGVANAITGGRYTEKAFVSMPWNGAPLLRKLAAWIVADGDEAMIVTNAC